MRQRITFFHRHEHGVDPDSLKLAGRSIAGPDIIAEREDRITLALDELPAELRDLLQESQELYIRWQSPVAYQTVGPWSSRLPPGLHVFYTPSNGRKLEGERLCPLLQAAFGPLDCSSISDSFTKLPNDRFSHSTAYQYYQVLESLAQFASYIEKRACVSPGSECKERAQRLAKANSVDFSYDAVSNVAKVTALWPNEPQPLSVDSHPDHRAEVGIMTPDIPPHLEQHEFGVTGLLSVLGQDTKPSPALFSFPSRHKSAAGVSFASGFLPPSGLHPTMQLRVSSSKPPMEGPYCSLHTYLTLPRAIFADKYQLGDGLFLSSKNLTSLRYISQPVDLEAPDYAIKLWGSSVLLELQPPDVQDDRPWTAEIPLHLRYLSPAEHGYRSIHVPWPAVFWACTAEDGTKFPSNPFDRVNLGYDGLFGQRTIFWHVDPRPESGGNLYHTIRVPVLDLLKSSWISAGTAAVVLAGFLFVVFKLASVYLRSGYGSQEAEKESDKKRQ
ncbi:PIG-X [Durotheca rogersii]|uniref:PIG-X n=1 Tax=Durotheca rogersii TaxID=419775 RepID=UPI00221F546A|nr:PIG-X [Durotheca rogersii]KAI5868063.1 PIG-X [Durotheca rogersii]